MVETQIETITEAWNEGMDFWHSPSIPRVITPNGEERKVLGSLGSLLERELAFMKYPEFQTYMNPENIEEKFSEDTARGYRAVAKHEIGHRFCPYDQVTMLILNHTVKKAIKDVTIPYSADSASHTILNLFTDMCINTHANNQGDEDITWAYQTLSGEEDKNTKLWRVYAKSMEYSWNKTILPEKIKLDAKEDEAARNIARLFEGDFFGKDRWDDMITSYARLISPFLEDEQKDGKGGLDDMTDNLPDSIDEKTEEALAKRLAEIGSDGLPNNVKGLEEFKEIMAGYGVGNPTKASIRFYDALSNAYDVMFSERPFGRPRTNPFQPVKWQPSMGEERLDANYSILSGGKIIPGVNTYAWNTRKRERFGGVEEVTPDLDIYLDSSGSTPDPTGQVSLFVLAGFVAAKKAHRKGRMVRATNFSGNRQYKTSGWINDLNSIFEVLVTHYNGGTVFPTGVIREAHDPRQALIITDTFIANEGEMAEAIVDVRKRNTGNKVTVYAIENSPKADILRNAGAEVIQGTTTDIFKKAIGKAGEVYKR